MVENSSGVVISTTENVTGSNATGYNVKTYGAKGDDVTDDTAAIAAACTAAGTGQLMFPPATYKITAGGISTCSPGVQISGYDATLDLTSLTGTMFSFNVGGPIVSSAPTTLIAGFKVNGSASVNALFLRADNVYNVTVRDIYAPDVATLAEFNGSSYYSLVEDDVVSFGETAVIYGQVSYGASQVPVGAKVSNLSCSNENTSCVSVLAGDVDIDRSTWNNNAIGLEINGGRGAFRNGQITLNSAGPYIPQNETAINIDSASAPAIFENSIVNFTGVNSLSLYGITNNTTQDVTISGSFTISQTAGLAIVYNTSASNRIVMSKTKVLQTTANTSGGLFSMGSTSVVISGVISGSEFTNTGSGSMNFVASVSSAGGFANTMISGNAFTGLTSITNIGSGSTFVGNFFAAPSGGVSVGLISTTAAMVGNTFSATPTMSGSHPPAACTANINYACN